MTRIKSMIVAFLVATLLLLCTGCSFGQSKGSNNSGGSSASWAEGFSNVNEMLDATRDVITGTVISNSTEIRHDIVFTRNQIQINKVIKGSLNSGDIIEVLQTGGRDGETVTPAFAEIPLLSLDSEYVMFISQTEPDELYGQYYLIRGGYQGIAEITNKNTIEPLSEANKVFVEGLGSFIFE